MLNLIVKLFLGLKDKWPKHEIRKILDFTFKKDARGDHEFCTGRDYLNFPSEMGWDLYHEQQQFIEFVDFSEYKVRVYFFQSVLSFHEEDWS